MPKISIGLSYPGWQGPNGGESREKSAPLFLPGSTDGLPSQVVVLWEQAGEALVRPALQEPSMELESEETERFLQERH